MTEVIINTLGDRITYCRSSLYLTRKELIEKWGCASIPTMARWELDTVRIPQKKLASLVQFFNNNGLVVTENWLKNGAGAPPFLLNAKLFNQFDFDSIAQEKLLDLNRQIKNFIFGQTMNNLMTPFIKYGDYVGGISFNDNVQINSMYGELVFLRTKMVGIIVGLIEEKAEDALHLKNLKGTTELININQIEVLGKVQWIIRRP